MKADEAILKGAILDMDGTILDSTRHWQRIPVEYVVSKGRVPSPTLVQELAALEVPGSAHYLKETYGLEETEEQIVRELYANIRSIHIEKATLLPHARELLAFLRGQGARVALFTASEVMAAAAAMMRNGVLHCFDLIINTSETGFTKDDPRAYFEVLRRLGTPAESTAIFEDAPYAVVGARKTGMRVFTPQDFPQLLGIQ